MSAATISHLTGEKLKSMKLPIPPLNLQNEFAERVQIIEQQKEQAKQALQKSENLFNSLLQRSFKGELVAEYELFLSPLPALQTNGR